MLQARQIECTRGNRRLFHDLSFRLEAKQALRVGGENGSGKTSLAVPLAAELGYPLLAKDRIKRFAPATTGDNMSRTGTHS